jgi:hypothetical protein
MLKFPKIQVAVLGMYVVQGTQLPCSPSLLRFNYVLRLRSRFLGKYVDRRSFGRRRLQTRFKIIQSQNHQVPSLAVNSWDQAVNFFRHYTTTCKTVFPCIWQGTNSNLHPTLWKVHTSSSPIPCLMKDLYRGQIHHIQPGTPSGNSEADIIFAEYQEQASAGQLAFQRWPLRSVSLFPNHPQSIWLGLAQMYTSLLRCPRWTRSPISHHIRSRSSVDKLFFSKL